MNLAIALAGRGHRVILFDLDMGLANADIVLGLDVSWTLSDVLAGRRGLQDAIVMAPGDFAFVPGASGIAGMADLSEFERYQLLSLFRQWRSRLRRDHPGLRRRHSRNVLTFGALGRHRGDRLHARTHRHHRRVRDHEGIRARAGAKRRNPGAAAAGSIGVIVNNTDSRQEGKEVYERLAGVAARFLHVPVTDYGYVLRDEHVPVAIRSRRPVLIKYPRCSASSCLLASAARVSAELGGPPREKACSPASCACSSRLASLQCVMP